MQMRLLCRGVVAGAGGAARPFECVFGRWLAPARRRFFASSLRKIFPLKWFAAEGSIEAYGIVPLQRVMGPAVVQRWHQGELMFCNMLAGEKKAAVNGDGGRFVA